jgi:hypothetical protein
MRREIAATHHDGMTISSTAETIKRHPAWTLFFLVMVVAPAALALAVFAALAIGPLGLLAPFLLGAAVYLYRAVVVSSLTSVGRTVAREVGAVLLAPAVGFGTYVTLTLIGVLTGILPFIGRSPDGHPYEDLWSTGSIVAAVAVAFGSWWLLRSWANPAPDETSQS